MNLYFYQTEEGYRGLHWAHSLASARRELESSEGMACDVRRARPSDVDYFERMGRRVPEDPTPTILCGKDPPMEATTLADFISAHGLTMDVEPADSNPSMPDPSEGSSHWTCTIRRGSASLVVSFSMGSALRRWTSKPRPGASQGVGTWQDCVTWWGAKHGRPSRVYERGETFKARTLKAFTEPESPDLETVLDCLASDASSVENATGFEDWADDFGYDTDSRKAEATYNITLAQSVALASLLGPQAYSTLLWDIERL